MNKSPKSQNMTGSGEDTYQVRNSQAFLVLTCTIQVKQVRLLHLFYIFHFKNLNSGSSVWLVWGLTDIAHVIALVLYYFLIVCQSCWLRTVLHRSQTDTSGFQGDTSPEHTVFTLCSSEGKNDERLWLALGRIDSSELQMGSNNLAKAWIHPLQPFHRY